MTPIKLTKSSVYITAIDLIQGSHIYFLSFSNTLVGSFRSFTEDLFLYGFDIRDLYE